MAGTRREIPFASDKHHCRQAGEGICRVSRKNQNPKRPLGAYVKSLSKRWANMAKKYLGGTTLDHPLDWVIKWMLVQRVDVIVRFLACVIV